MDTAPTHGRNRRWTVVLIPPGNRKKPPGVPVGFPGGAKQRQRLGGQGDIPVLSALPAMDMDLEALAIDVRAREGEGFREPEAQAIDRGEVNVVV